MQLPKKYTFAEAFDYFFKMHNVLNIEVHRSLRLLFQFFSMYGYEMNNSLKDQTPTCARLYEQLRQFKIEQNAP